MRSEIRAAAGRRVHGGPGFAIKNTAAVDRGLAVVGDHRRCLVGRLCTGGCGRRYGRKKREVRWQGRPTAPDRGSQVRSRLAAGGRWISNHRYPAKFFWRPIDPRAIHLPQSKPAPSRQGPMVRIHLPPADSPSLARIRFRASRTPAFRAGVRGWLGDRVGRDAQGVSISRQPAAISLSGHIPVPRCR